ncbi:MAG TPA: 50S ribosomal protein L17 [Pelobium sp.]|nr:50S ribosomal protein L17 [Pelobium sp.]
MRHGKKFNHLGRKTAHRKAMLANMASSLIEHKRITTTLAKAKALRVYVEPIITKSKNDTTHSRRTVFAYLQNKEVVTTLFREVAEKVATRPGGYTRIVKLGNRLGDNAEMALIELVDFNTTYNAEAKVEKKSTRRRGSKAKKADAPVADAKVEDAVVAEEAPEAKAEETPVETPAKEEKIDSSEEEKTAE